MAKNPLVSSLRMSRLSRTRSTGNWAARAVQGSFVEAHLGQTVDDATLLMGLPATDALAPGLNLPDEFGLDMCSVDSTTTCPSTTWCSSTTACQSTTNCKSVQTCIGNEVAAPPARGQTHAPAGRIWPVAVS